MRLRTCLLSVFTLTTAMFSGIAVRAADPVQVSGTHTYKIGKGDILIAPIGGDPNHMLFVFKETGANTNTSKTKFLDQAKDEGAGYGDWSQGAGPIYGYNWFTDADGMFQWSYIGHCMPMMKDNKPSETTCAGNWLYVRGTGRYANGGQGGGSWTSSSTAKEGEIEGSAEWTGTFTPADKTE